MGGSCHQCVYQFSSLGQENWLPEPAPLHCCRGDTRHKRERNDGKWQGRTHWVFTISLFPVCFFFIAEKNSRNCQICIKNRFRLQNISHVIINTTLPFICLVYILLFQWWGVGAASTASADGTSLQYCIFAFKCNSSIRKSPKQCQAKKKAKYRKKECCISFSKQS